MQHPRIDSHLIASNNDLNKIARCAQQRAAVTPSMCVCAEAADFGIANSPPRLCILCLQITMQVLTADACVRRSCARDLLSVALGEDGGVPPERARALDACLLRLAAPPAPASLRRFATRVAGGGHRALLRTLSSSRVAVPDVEEAAASRCTLCREPLGRRFANARVQRYFSQLFLAAASLAAQVGLPLSLSRFDLFHAHLFVSKTQLGRRCLGLLFHAREYPCAVPFANTLGFCQEHSHLLWDAALSAKRNLLYLVPAVRDQAPFFAVLDAGDGTLLSRELLHPGLAPLHTILEEDFGQELCDLNYLHRAPRLPSASRLFVCA